MMHQALQIEEILRNIFGHCHTPGYAVAGMAPLARTCRAFKEPALDVLWEELYNLAPLARCLPDASRCLSRDQGKEYSFSRPLTQAEWDVLRSYARRIRCIGDFCQGLDETSRTVLKKPPTTEPLFPNVRQLSCAYHGLDERILELLPETFPNIRSLSLKWRNGLAKTELASSHIRSWKNLENVTCTLFVLGADTLSYLSSMPALTRLEFRLSTPFPISDSTLAFSNLSSLTVLCNYWVTLFVFLYQTRLPAITDFTAEIDQSLSREDLSFFLACVQKFHARHTLKGLAFYQHPYVIGKESPILHMEDLKPCMTFNNLIHLKFGFQWDVTLTDSDLLMLASAWPRLEQLLINLDWGWNTLGGITPEGLVELLRTCPLLTEIALAIDTGGHAELPLPGSLGPMLKPTLVIHVLDSRIEEAAMEPFAAFFAALAPSSELDFTAWNCFRMARPLGFEVYRERWNDVFERVKDSVGRHS